MNNILITGGAGFIGRNFINQLQNKYDQIFVIDNFSLGIRDQFDCKNITIIEFDLKNEFLDYEKFGKCNIDEIWHFAANSDIAAGIENDLVDCIEQDSLNYSHSENLHVFIKELLNKNNTELNQLSAISVNSLFFENPCNFLYVPLISK